MPADALDRTLLPTFLGDHLALAVGAAELARRASGTSTRPFLDGPLADLPQELAAERTALLRVHEILGVRRDRVKEGGAWVGEKVGRLKLNGELRDRSPLSPVVELEGLLLGIEGKRALWVALSETDAVAQRIGAERLRELTARAERQRSAVEERRVAAARRALTA